MLNIFGNGTDIVSWVAEPTRRGTFSLLSSCVITILLCVWTAVHLNIPEKADEKRPWFAKRQFWRKVKWMIIALFAPEFVAYTAWRQWRDAKDLLDDLYSLDYRSLERSERQGTTESSNTAWKHWKMRHAFYAVMSGFVLDVTDTGPPIAPKNQEVLVLTPEVLVELILLRPALAPTISVVEIKDKSKASDMTKAIVCAQASWFIAQCVTRMAQHLPISLLELNTLGHSICALFIYCIWWNKPLDVDQPTRIVGDGVREVYTFIQMYCCSLDDNSGRSSHDPNPYASRSSQVYDLRLTPEEYEKLERQDYASFVSSNSNGRPGVGGTYPLNMFSGPEDTVSLEPGQNFLSTGLEVNESVCLSTVDVERRKLGIVILKELAWIGLRDGLSVEDEYRYMPWISDSFHVFAEMVNRATNFKSEFFEWEWEFSFSGSIALGLASFLYGGLHLLAGLIRDHHKLRFAVCGLDVDC